jgi:hypothetical protein
MATFKCDIPSEHNEMIKRAAAENYQSRQKYLEQKIMEIADKQAKKVLLSK